MSSASARRVLSAAAVVALLAGSALPAAAEVIDEGPPPEPDDLAPGALAESVHSYTREGAVQAYGVDGAVRELGDGPVQEGSQRVITLATDILFTANSWELPDNAAARIIELVEDIPDGAEVAVIGHTDSRPTLADFDNQELSENRADSVAEVLGDQRGDLVLEVEGRADSDPAERESEGDPDTFAANRRVEIVYEN